ncbi:ABC transporter ATP-binding protein [Pusillimonas sp. DMV24BSW_D]|uniref:ABC transporter ATP-binding protein n=1 Tax=Neopusillimonas aestuarii TaxID=2716226 RepID=UPI0014089472|nr:ABC transporter ATP-binding protein [Pusillimonas sp. DMV24BSW_D]QIM48467.1 ABC transporter ATP-binding protein [Pusillimonas sp. DMV24BSW_D]
MNDVLLRAENVSKHFGGLVANDNVSLSVYKGKTHAILGPNGAGKSTLINMLSGDLTCSSGSVFLGNLDVTHLQPNERSLLGIGRSYQKTNIFPMFTVLENCRLAAQSREPRLGAVFSSASNYEPYKNLAEKAIWETGLEGYESRVASALSHGEQRQLELAIVLATQPSVLLLDEPLAGMGSEESFQMIDLLKKLVKTHGILLVEHDMDAVFAIADIITVMVNGSVLMTDTPDRVRASAEVQQAYFGH